MSGPGLSSRAYAGPSDLAAMRHLLMAARARSGNDWSHAHVGLLAWDFFMVVCHQDPARHVRLWYDEAGLAGYAMAGDEQLDWQVLPEHAWSGIEEEALAWGEALHRSLLREHPERGGEPLVCGAREDDAARRAFLTGHGFRYRGESAEVDMIRALDGPLPAHPTPAGFEVRSVAGTEEAEERAAAEQDVWRGFTVGEVTGAQYAVLMQMPGYERSLDVVAVAADGTIAAYVNCWCDPVNGIGDLGPVGARPAYRRRGLTRAVLWEGMRRLREAGMDRVCVSTGIGNDAARSLYESVGFRIVNRYLDHVR